MCISYTHLYIYKYIHIWNGNDALEIDAIIIASRNLASGAVPAVRHTTAPGKLGLLRDGKGVLNLHVRQEHSLP